MGTYKVNSAEVLKAASGGVSCLYAVAIAERCFASGADPSPLLVLADSHQEAQRVAIGRLVTDGKLLKTPGLQARSGHRHPLNVTSTMVAKFTEQPR